jgi:hypothetical protein
MCNVALASRVTRDHAFDALMAWVGRVATNHTFVVAHI